MIDKNIDRFIHRNISRYRICPISIRHYLKVEFVLESSDNIKNYDNNRVFYLNENAIVIKYKIKLNEDNIYIPVINSKDICNKISLHREFMIKYKYIKRVNKIKRKKQIKFILNSILPYDIANSIRYY